MKIATHHCLNVTARRARRLAERFTPPGAGARRGPRRAAGCSRIARRCAELLSRFDPETQAAAIHYYVDEMTLEEVATLLGRSVPTIRKRLESFTRLSQQEYEQDERESRGKQEHRRSSHDVQPHIKEMALRRFCAGRARRAGAPAIEAHTAACARCRARLKEHRATSSGASSRRSPFERFAAGVERAARTPRRVTAPRARYRVGRTMRWFFPLASVRRRSR